MLSTSLPEEETTEEFSWVLPFWAIELDEPLESLPVRTVVPEAALLSREIPVDDPLSVVGEEGMTVVVVGRDEEGFPPPPLPPSADDVGKPPIPLPLPDKKPLVPKKKLPLLLPPLLPTFEGAEPAEGDELPSAEGEELPFEGEGLPPFKAIEILPLFEGGELPLFEGEKLPVIEGEELPAFKGAELLTGDGLCPGRAGGVD
jgi:hypothetical protein